MDQNRQREIAQQCHLFEFTDNIPAQEFSRLRATGNLRRKDGRYYYCDQTKSIEFETPGRWVALDSEHPHQGYTPILLEESQGFGAEHVSPPHDREEAHQIGAPTQGVEGSSLQQQQHAGEDSASNIAGDAQSGSSRRRSQHGRTEHQQSTTIQSDSPMATSGEQGHEGGPDARRSLRGDEDQMPSERDTQDVDDEHIRKQQRQGEADVDRIAFDTPTAGMEQEGSAVRRDQETISKELRERPEAHGPEGGRQRHFARSDSNQMDAAEAMVQGPRDDSLRHHPRGGEQQEQRPGVVSIPTDKAARHGIAEEKEDLAYVG